jgi:hypothetical protein
MKLQLGTKTQKTKITGNTIAYALFSVVGIAYFLWKDTSQAVVFFGLALVFDPFDPTVKWGSRPLYQRAWLLVHCLLALAAFVGMLFFNLPLNHPVK